MISTNSTAPTRTSRSKSRLARSSPCRGGQDQHLGVCNVTKVLLGRALKSAPIASVQNNHNLIDRTDPRVLEACRRDGLVFFAYFPLGDVGDGSIPRLVNLEPCSPLARVDGRHGAKLASVALAWLIRTLPFAVPIPGTSSPAHLQENVAAWALASRLTPDDIAELATMPTAAASTDRAAEELCRKCSRRCQADCQIVVLRPYASLTLAIRLNH